MVIQILPKLQPVNVYPLSNIVMLPFRMGLAYTHLQNPWLFFFTLTFTKKLPIQEGITIQLFKLPPKQGLTIFNLKPLLKDNFF